MSPTSPYLSVSSGLVSVVVGDLSGISLSGCDFGVVASFLGVFSEFSLSVFVVVKGTFSGCEVRTVIGSVFKRTPASSLALGSEGK